MKQALKVSIDEKILEIINDNIPNKSEFVEECFKAYLSFATKNEEERGEELRKAWADFNRAKLNIHLLMKIDYEGRDIENAINRQKTEAWLTVWSDYRRVGSTENTKIEKASKVLEIEPEVLKQTLENTLSKSELDKSKLYIFDNWNYIETSILPYVEVEEEYDLDDLLNGKVDLD